MVAQQTSARSVDKKSSTGHKSTQMLKRYTHISPSGLVVAVLSYAVAAMLLAIRGEGHAQGQQRLIAVILQRRENGIIRPQPAIHGITNVVR